MSLARVLLSEGRPSTEQLERGQWVYARRVVLGIFLWKEGHFHFHFHFHDGDCGAVLSLAVDEGLWLTTRATHNRRVVHDSRVQYLRPTVAAVEPQASYLLAVPAGPNRTERLATVHVQHCPVEVDLKHRPSGRHRRVRLWAVRVYEIDTAPCSQERIEWMLLTSWPVESIEAVLFVVRAYAARWRIEDFHRASSRARARSRRPCSTDESTSSALRYCVPPWPFTSSVSSTSRAARLTSPPPSR